MALGQRVEFQLGWHGSEGTVPKGSRDGEDQGGGLVGGVAGRDLNGLFLGADAVADGEDGFEFAGFAREVGLWYDPRT